MLLLVSCKNKNASSVYTENERIPASQDSVKMNKLTVNGKRKQESIDLVDVSVLNPSIYFELKYATAANFTGQILYKQIKRPYLVKEVAEKLSQCQVYLEKLHPGYHLLIYDAVRPQIVQERMWKALDTIPVSDRIKFVSNPKNGSVHNYGAAVDLTISDAEGTPLDMGANFDDLRLVAYPMHEKRFLESGELSLIQVENRKLLRAVMHSQGFRNLPTEWWHFNAYSRAEVKAKFKLIRYEEEIGVQRN
jgi:D-alanyl-D-alanine dipeptidase